MQSAWNFIKEHKKAFLIAGGCFAGLLVLAGLLQWARNAWNQHELNVSNQQENIAVKQAENINANLANLQLQYTEAQGNANVSKAQREELKKQVNAAQVESNKALENVNAAKNANYSGTTVDQANAARCRAFPDSPECP